MECKKAKAYEDAIDDAMDRARYVDVSATLWFWALCYGTAFNAVSWEAWEVLSKKRMPQFDQFGNFQGMLEEIYPTQKENLHLEAVPFWQMGFSKIGQNLTAKDWCYRWSLRSVAQMERMIDLGRWPGLPKSFNTDRLKEKHGSAEVGFAKQFNQHLGMGDFDNEDETVGILYELYSGDRWISVWNLNIDLDPKNQEPRLYNVDRRTKPFAQLKLPAGVKGDQFWPEGLWEQIRDKADLANMLASLHAQHLFKDAVKVKMVDTRFFDAETIRNIGYGDVISYDGSQLTSGRPPIDVLDQGQPDESLPAMGEWIRERIEDIGNEPAIVRGESPSPQQTATGMGMLQQNVAPLQTFLTALTEGTYKVELAALVISEYSSNARYTDFARAVGFKRAEMAMTPDVFAGLYGGFHAHFEGADRVGARAVRFEKFMQFYNFAAEYLQALTAAGDPAALQRMEALFQAWEPYVDGIPDQQRDIIFGQGEQQPQPVQPPMPGMEGQAPVSQMPPNQVQTPVMNREIENQGA
jgi:hypothetical protein